jgi:hypothetical protein
MLITKRAFDKTLSRLKSEEMNEKFLQEKIEAEGASFYISELPLL